MKIGAAEILQNLKFPNGSAIIPRHAVVYISTDDPDGICKDCYVQRKPCTTYTTPKPQGCPEDVSSFHSQKHTKTLIKTLETVFIIFVDKLECVYRIWLENSFLTGLSESRVFAGGQSEYLWDD